VIAVDRNPGALKLAKALGADHALVSGGPVAGSSVAAPSPGGHAVPDQVHRSPVAAGHVAIDAVGSEETCTESIFSLRRRGRHVQVGLLPPVDGHPRVPMARVIGWELDLLGSHGMAAADYPGMLALIEGGDLRPQELIERVIGLHEAAALLPEYDKASPRRDDDHRPAPVTRQAVPPPSPASKARHYSEELSSREALYRL